MKKKKGIVGSTTACIVILSQDELRIANIGDCGVSVIRRNNYVFRSEEQQHSFNFPYQLGTASFDSPNDAQVTMEKKRGGGRRGWACFYNIYFVAIYSKG